MDDSEQPSASRAAVARTTQACQRCRSLKTRCLPSTQAGVCQRCSAGGRECIWAETPRRVRKLRAPSRISQVEQKIDGLVAKLVKPQIPLPDQDVAASQWTGTPLGGQTSTRPPAAGGVASWTETWKKQGNVAPGSWLPLPSSFEQGEPDDGSLDNTATYPTEDTRRDAHEEPNYETEADRQFFETVRSTHATQGLFQPNRLREPPLEHALVQELLSTHEADRLLNEYRQMSASYPFVVVPPGATAYDLHREKPMLFLAMIIAASSQDHIRQMSLDTIFRRELAERTMITPKRTLGLVQGVLVYLSWYHFVFSHKTQQVFFMHHLSIGLALDIGLHRDYQPMNLPHRPKPRAQSPHDQRERERTFLGCYYLSSMISAGLQKPNLLKHTPYMTESAQNLKHVREYDTDETISHLVALRQIDDQVQDSLFSDDAKDLPLSNPRIIMHVRFLQGQLEAWKIDSQDAGEQRSLILSSSFTEMLLHSVALRPTTTEEPLSGADSTKLDSLLCALEAGKHFLDTLLSIPIDEYHVISFSEWMRLPAVIMTVAKMCMPNNTNVGPGWNYKTAQDRVRLDLCLEALCYRMQQLSTFEKQKQTDFWHAMRFINDLTRTWYMKKIKLSTSSQPTPSTITGCPMSERSGPSAGALATPASEQGMPNFGMDMSNMSMRMGVGDDGDPFAALKDMDFDMGQFLDMGIWGDETYTGMGFGGDSSMSF